MFKKLFDKFKKKDKENENIINSEVENKEEEQKQEEAITEEPKEIIETKTHGEENKVIESFDEILEEKIEKVDEIKENIDLVNEETIKENMEEINNNLEATIEEIIENSDENTEKYTAEKIEKEELIEEIIEEIKDEAVQEKETNEIQEVEEQPSKLNLFQRLKEGLTKTKQGITDKVDNLLKMYVKVDEELFEELEEILITSDIGVNTTLEIVDQLRDRVKSKKITEGYKVRDELKDILRNILGDEQSSLNVEPAPAIILVVGVNGVGKTTTIAKMANRFKSEGKTVLLAAGDTFRAAAIDQLEIWGQRVGVDVIKHEEGSDPGAVIFDAIKAAQSRKADILICDTAGRLHNKKNLMNELGKVFKIVEKEYPDATKEILLVVDATTGQNAVQQAKVFKEVANITGIVLTKLDGTAKGGVILAVKSELKVPVKLIGVGEKMDDLQDFNAKDFADALFPEENK